MPETTLNNRQRSLLLDALDCYRNHLLLSAHAVFSPEIMHGMAPASIEELWKLMELVNPALGNAAIAPPAPIEQGLRPRPALSLKPDAGDNDYLLRSSAWLEVAEDSQYPQYKGATFYVYQPCDSEALCVEYRSAGTASDDPADALMDIHPGI